MSNKRKLIGAAAIAAGLAGGGAAGALLGLPTTSLAQTDETTTTTTQEDATTADDSDGRRGFGHHGFGFGGGIDLGVAAEALGITEDELETALEDGGSIASVAEERGVDLQTVVDAMVAAANTSIDERVAELREELPDRVADLVEREGGFGGRGGGFGGPRGGFGLVDLDVAAEALGVTEDDLRDAFEDGDSITEVAEAQGVDVAVVTDALLAAANAELDDEVADGDLTEEEATEIRDDLPDRIADIVEGNGGFGRGGLGRGFGGGRGGPGPGGFGS